MSWELLFAATNLVAVLGWLALAALPRREGVLAAVQWGGVALLCAAYAAMFVALLGGLVDPGRDGAAPAAFEYSVEGLRQAFAARGAIVVGWTHYLAFDLFVGLWIARDADARGLARAGQLPFLFATFMAGPIGLLAWLALRKVLSRR
jgi:hypothetical protein